jgi:hypothetical protein
MPTETNSFLIHNNLIIMGLGSTEAQAWADAAKDLCGRSTRKDLLEYFEEVGVEDDTEVSECTPAAFQHVQDYGGDARAWDGLRLVDGVFDVKDADE